MKSFFFFFIAALLSIGSAQSQTQPNATTTASGLSVRPAGPLPNRRQELYDEYHGITKKPASPAPIAPVDNQTRPSPPKPAQPAPAEETVATRPVSSLSSSSPSGVWVGVRGGVTRLIYLDQLPDVNANPTLSFVGGFVFNFGQGTVSFQPELNYARYALKNTNGPGSSLTQAVDWFEVPLLLKIASGSINTNRFFINIGPYGAYLSSASLNGQKLSLDGSNGRFSVGAVAGLGAAFKAGQGHVTLELRGLYGLHNAANGIAFNTEFKSLNTQATVGYTFPLGGNRY